MSLLLSWEWRKSKNSSDSAYLHGRWNITMVDEHFTEWSTSQDRSEFRGLAFTSWIFQTDFHLIDFSDWLHPPAGQVAPINTHRTNKWQLHFLSKWVEQTLWSALLPPHRYFNRNKLLSSKHWWFSGRILACHAGGPGSIPGQCIFFLLSSFFFFLVPIASPHTCQCNACVNHCCACLGYHQCQMSSTFICRQCHHHRSNQQTNHAGELGRYLAWLNISNNSYNRAFEDHE